MRPVSVIGIAQLPVKKRYDLSLRQLGASVARSALDDAGVEKADALYVSNMLSDELQCQKHLGALIADEAELTPIEAMQIRAAMASGAAALRVGAMAVASGCIDLALIVGVEKMSDGPATQSLAKALDSEKEMPDGATMVSQVADLTRHYIEKYNLAEEDLGHFPVNAHRNAKSNPYALFQDRQFTVRQILESRIIMPPLRLLDCSPICDGASSVLLAPTEIAHQFTSQPVHIAASSMATDRFRVSMRTDPLQLSAAAHSAELAFRRSELTVRDIDFFEVHDAFSIMSCLALEAVGFATRGNGWRLAAEGQIAIDGSIPLSTMGGLKARGHPIGATALYQVCEIVQQLRGTAGQNQVNGAKTALMQSVGGAGTSVLTHIFRV